MLIVRDDGHNRYVLGAFGSFSDKWFNFCLIYQIIVRDNFTSSLVLAESNISANPLQIEMN